MKLTLTRRQRRSSAFTAILADAAHAALPRRRPRPGGESDTSVSGRLARPVRWSWPKTARAVFAGSPGTASSSSCEAARKRSAEPKWLQDRAPAGRPDALQRVEDRRERARVTLLPVERDREPVRLVADALEQLQPGIVPVEQDRLRAAGHEHLLLALREGDRRRRAAGSDVAWIASSAAASCPLPPSITTRFGTAAKLSS